MRSTLSMRASWADVESPPSRSPTPGEQAPICEILVRSGRDIVVIDLSPRRRRPIEGDMGDSHVGLQAPS